MVSIFHIWASKACKIALREWVFIAVLENVSPLDPLRSSHLLDGVHSAVVCNLRVHLVDFISPLQDRTNVSKRNGKVVRSIGSRGGETR